MNDEKTAADYKVQGGSVLHLVLALKRWTASVEINSNQTTNHSIHLIEK